MCLTIYYIILNYIISYYKLYLVITRRVDNSKTYMSENTTDLSQNCTVIYLFTFNKQKANINGQNTYNIYCNHVFCVAQIELPRLLYILLLGTIVLSLVSCCNISGKWNNNDNTSTTTNPFSMTEIPPKIIF